MIEPLHEFKKSFFKHGRIQEVDNVSAGKSENWQFAGRLCIIKNWKFSCVLHAHSQFLWSFARFDHANRGVRQPVQPHTFYARLLVFDKTSAASFCSCKLLGRSDECVLLPVLTCSLIFLHLWTAVSWRWLYFPPISYLRALIVYITECRAQGRGLGLNPPLLELDILQNFMKGD